MGDMAIVRGSVTGTPRAKKMLAGGAIEEGDLVTTTAGEAIKVADDGAAVTGVAMEAAADTETLMVFILGSGTYVEGVNLDAAVIGDLVGVNVTSTNQKFEKGGSNKTFKVVKVPETGVVQCEILDSVIG